LNRGNVFNELNRTEEALADYGRAIARKPDHAEAHCNLAVALLLAGDLDRGWVEYEWRRRRPGARLERGSISAPPLWLGDAPIDGKIILLRAEQGFGDTLQFCRYVESVADLNASVILEAQAPLVALLSSLEGASRVIARGSEPPPCDYQCPLLSLPLAFRTHLNTIPSRVKYLEADPDTVRRWQARLGAKLQPRVGLVWSGSTVHRNNNRPIALAALIAALPKQFQYVSLQKECRAADLEVLREHPEILSFAAELTDFSETAALSECMDLVISIDTSVAHLAAALGKPTWILLAFNPDWRWLLGRDDSPWYPSARLYRQAGIDEWGPVLARVCADLVRTL
jgi:tetratricopeptide (TPR) repeat protein